jgi:hypothetical protein
VSKRPRRLDTAKPCGNGSQCPSPIYLIFRSVRAAPLRSVAVRPIALLTVVPRTSAPLAKPRHTALRRRIPHSPNAAHCRPFRPRCFAAQTYLHQSTTAHAAPHTMLTKPARATPFRPTPLSPAPHPSAPSPRIPCQTSPSQSHPMRSVSRRTARY